MIAVILFVIVFLLLVGIPFKAFKKISKYVLRGILSIMIVFILNYIFSSNSFHIPINYVTCAFLSVLGIPGVVALGVVSIYFV